MRTAVVILLLAIFLSGCTEVSYREPQPKGKRALSSVPKKLQGKYVVKDNDEKDTLIVTSTGYIIASEQVQVPLSDSLVLKKYKGYYFINLNEDPEWLLRVFRREKNGDLIFMSMKVEGRSFNEMLAEISKEVAVDSSTVNDETLYQIDPTPKQLLKLIRKGYFGDTVRYTRIN
jgi:PBP1b-binding outer membrane lipoprotein LpoB